MFAHQSEIYNDNKNNITTIRAMWPFLLFIYVRHMRCMNKSKFSIYYIHTSLLQHFYSALYTMPFPACALTRLIVISLDSQYLILRSLSCTVSSFRWWYSAWFSFATKGQWTKCTRSHAHTEWHKLLRFLGKKHALRFSPFSTSAFMQNLHRRPMRPLLHLCLYTLSRAHHLLPERFQGMTSVYPDLDCQNRLAKQV